MNDKNLRTIKYLLVIVIIVLIAIFTYVIVSKSNEYDIVNNTDYDITEEYDDKFENEGTEDSDEFNEIMKNNIVIDLLNKQHGDVTDIKVFLENDKYNNYIIYMAYRKITDTNTNENIDLSKNNIQKNIKELFGYDLEIKFNDIMGTCDQDEIALQYNNELNKYIEIDDGSYFGCGEDFFGEYHHWYYDELKTSNNGKEYTVLAKQIWSDEELVGDYSSNYYASYEDAKNSKNPIISLTEDETNELWSGFNRKPLFKKSTEINTYEYKFVKEDGIVKIISYKKIS